MTPILEAAHRARDAAHEAEKAAEKLRETLLSLVPPGSGPPAALFEPELLALVSEADTRVRFAQERFGKILSLAIAQILGARVCAAEAQRILDAIQAGDRTARGDCTCATCAAKRTKPAPAPPEGSPAP